MDIPELFSNRAPGNTCLDAIADMIARRKVENDSKGCGGVMRIAPVALYGAAEGRIKNIRTIDRMAAEASDPTRKYPLGSIPSALVAHLVYNLVQDEVPNQELLENHIVKAMALLRELFPQHCDEVTCLSQLIERAIRLSEMKEDNCSIIETYLGSGWAAERTLAIALYCVLKYRGCPIRRRQSWCRQ